MNTTLFSECTEEALVSWAEARGVQVQSLERIFEGIRPGPTSSPPAPGQMATIFFPGLRAQPFWNRSDFSWMPLVELAVDGIRADYEQHRSMSAESRLSETFRTEGGHWSVNYITCVGRYFPRSEEYFPRTVAALRNAPGALSCGMTHFSTITPQTHILPHSGFTNAHLRCHLTLHTHDGCRIRVGSEIRGWPQDQVLIFDDTYEHEVWNDSKGERTVLLFDVFHPDLTPVECDALDYLAGIWRRRVMLEGLSGGQMAA